MKPAPSTLSINVASLCDCIDIMAYCCDSPVKDRVAEGIIMWEVQSIKLNRLVCAIDRDLIEFMEKIKSMPTMTSVVRSGAARVVKSDQDGVTYKQCAFEACLGALLDTNSWCLCKVAVHRTGPRCFQDAMRTVDGLFYPIGRSRAMLIIDDGRSFAPSKGNQRWDLKCTANSK